MIKPVFKEISKTNDEREIIPSIFLKRDFEIDIIFELG